MNNIFCDIDMNEYKLLGTKLKQIVNALKVLKILLFRFFKTIKKKIWCY